MMLPVDVNDSDLACDYYLDYDYDYRLSLIALNLFLASSYFHSSTANPSYCQPRLYSNRNRNRNLIKIEYISHNL